MTRADTMPRTPAPLDLASRLAVGLLVLLLTLSGLVAWKPGFTQAGAEPLISGIDINRAAAPELELLPRIGPALAARIVQDRAANGPFASVDDLDRVKGIGPRTIEALRAHAIVTTPDDPALPAVHDR